MSLPLNRNWASQFSGRVGKQGAGMKGKAAVVCKQIIVLILNSKGKVRLILSIYDTLCWPFRQKWDANFAFNYFFKGLLGYYTVISVPFLFLVAINDFVYHLFKHNHDLIHRLCPNIAPHKLMRILPLKETSIFHWDYTSDLPSFLIWNTKVHSF